RTGAGHHRQPHARAHTHTHAQLRPPFQDWLPAGFIFSMHRPSESYDRSQVEAAGGEPHVSPVSAAALQGERRAGGDRANREAELEFEALVSSGETRRYVLTSGGVHVREPAEDESKAGRGGPEAVGPDHAVIPPAGSAAAAPSPLGVPRPSAPPPTSLLTQARAAAANSWETTTDGESKNLGFSDPRSKTELLAYLRQSPPQAPMPPTDGPIGSRLRETLTEPPIASTLDVDSIQSAPAESGILDPPQSGVPQKVWYADMQLTGPDTADTGVLPVPGHRRRSLSQSAILADVFTASKRHSRDPPRRSSSLRAARKGIGTWARNGTSALWVKVVAPPSRNSSRCRQRRAEHASEEYATDPVGAHDAPEKEAGPGSTDDESQADSGLIYGAVLAGSPEAVLYGAVLAGSPEAVLHGYAPDVVAADVATVGVVQQVPQEQERAGRENKPVGEAMPPEKPYQAFGVPYDEQPYAAGETSPQKSETTPLQRARPNDASGMSTSRMDWRAECLPVALSKVESVAQSAQRLAEENARLRKE
ncbi:MAG: hypothetical protein BJ554DRAFT_1851, partial [Olpidium bornovanus]